MAVHLSSGRLGQLGLVGGLLAKNAALCHDKCGHMRPTMRMLMLMPRTVQNRLTKLAPSGFSLHSYTENIRLWLAIIARQKKKEPRYVVLIHSKLRSECLLSLLSPPVK